MGSLLSTTAEASLQRKPSLIHRGDYQEGIALKSRIFKKYITDDYNFSSKIVGTGFSGPVRLATHKQTGQICAVKRYDKNAADLIRIEHLKSEAEVYLRLDHPNICKLFGVYEEPRFLFLVMEYCSGQELYHRLHERTVYRESDAREVAKQMVEAVNYLHCHHVVHRDLKLENWLYEKSDDDVGGRLKLIDFGFSKIWHSNKSKKMNASCGSLSYISPETLNGSYTNMCDMWSLGVTVYFLLVGFPPFLGGTERKIVDRILRGSYSMDGDRWGRISDEGKDFVKHLLVVEPSDRMTSREALKHPWIDLALKESTQTPLDQSVLHSLRQFALASHMKRAALTMMAYSLTTKEIEDLTALFQQFDRNHDGCLSFYDFMDVMKDNFNISTTEAENLFHAMASIPAANNEFPENEICYSDFIAALLQTRLQFHEDKIRQAFLRFDVDRSGYITSDDLREVIGAKFEGMDVDDIVRAADANGDGRIDYEEFLAAVLAEVQAEDVVVTPKSPAASGEEPSPAASKSDRVAWELREEEPSAREEARAERRQKFLRQLLGVVDSNLRTGGGLNLISPSTRSSPYIFHDLLFGDQYISHARPYDVRFERESDKSFELPRLASFISSRNPIPPTSSNLSSPFGSFSALQQRPRMQLEIKGDLEWSPEIQKNTSMLMEQGVHSVVELRNNTANISLEDNLCRHLKVPIGSAALPEQEPCALGGSTAIEGLHLETAHAQRMLLCMHPCLRIEEPPLLLVHPTRLRSATAPAATLFSDGAEMPSRTVTTTAGCSSNEGSSSPSKSDIRQPVLTSSCCPIISSDRATTTTTLTTGVEESHGSLLTQVALRQSICRLRQICSEPSMQGLTPLPVLTPVSPIATSSSTLESSTPKSFTLLSNPNEPGSTLASSTSAISPLTLKSNNRTPSTDDMPPNLYSNFHLIV